MVRTMPPYKCTRKARQSDVSTNPNQSLPIRPESIAHSEQGTRVAADSNKHTEPSFRLDLNLRQGCLDYFNRGPADRTFQTESLQGQIDLKSLLSLKERRWDTGTRCALAVLLAYTLLYLYGGSHFQGLWQRENISFFHDGDRIPLRPFFGATLADDAFWRRGNAASPDSQHRHPDILMLGVMLLEIYLGKRLESFLEMDGDITDVNSTSRHGWLTSDSSSKIFPGGIERSYWPASTPNTFR